MRRTWRTVTATLMGSVAVTAALLASAPAQAAAGSPGSPGSPATPVPPLPGKVLAGTWVNTDPSTRNVVDLVVGTSERAITVDGFGACTPTPCEWGRITGTAFGPDVSAKTGTSFEAQWDFKFSRIVLLASYSTRKKVPTLTVREFTTFTDGSSRADYTATETFTKGRPVKVTTTGTSASDYPLGDSVAPVAALPAVWVNTASTGNVRAVILSIGPGGVLRVHAYGFCSPVPCNWGTVSGVTFGSGISSMSGSTFLAPYTFGFASKLLDGSVNPAGTLLTVRIWTEFTDHSGRSNYLSTNTFVPLRDAFTVG